MWAAILAATGAASVAVILTTHSMEEVRALPGIVTMVVWCSSAFEMQLPSLLLFLFLERLFQLLAHFLGACRVQSHLGCLEAVSMHVWPPRLVQPRSVQGGCFFLIVSARFLFPARRWRCCAAGWASCRVVAWPVLAVHSDLRLCMEVGRSLSSCHPSPLGGLNPETDFWVPQPHGCATAAAASPRLNILSI